MESSFVDTNVLVMLVMLLVMVGIYFLPSIIAQRRHHHQATAIFALNAFLGWSFLGWVLALVWSLTAVVEKK